jgi:hypothetical protein
MELYNIIWLLDPQLSNNPGPGPTFTCMCFDYACKYMVHVFGIIFTCMQGNHACVCVHYNMFVCVRVCVWLCAGVIQ